MNLSKTPTHTIKGMSFNKYQRNCPNHQMKRTINGHKCYCAMTNKTCNTFTCPLLHGREYDERERRSSRSGYARNRRYTRGLV